MTVEQNTCIFYSAHRALSLVPCTSESENSTTPYTFESVHWNRVCIKLKAGTVRLIAGNILPIRH